MPKQSRKKKRNVNVGVEENNITKQCHYLLQLPPPPETLLTSSSKYLSGAFPIPRGTRTAMRFKGTEGNVYVSKRTKIVHKSIPMMEDARVRKSTADLSQVPISVSNSSTVGVTAQVNAAIDGLVASIIPPAPVDSPAAPNQMNPSTLRPARTSQKFEDCYLHSPPPEPNGDLNPAAAINTAYNIIGDGQLLFGEAMVASNVIEERPEESIDLTEIADMWADDVSIEDHVESSLVSVQGYRVKEASALLLGNILEKHGDIALNCNMESVEVRSFMLEKVCEVVKELQEKDFANLTQIEIDRWLRIVDDCKTANVEVGWLKKRLDEIRKAKVLVKNSSNLKEARNRNQQVLNEIKRKLEELTTRQNAAEVEAKEIQQKISYAKATMSYFITHPLAHDLL